MSGEFKKPKPELVALFRLEFYRKQKNWKLCRELRKEKNKGREEKDKSKTPAVSKILNSTYSIETQDGHSLHNQAFLESETDNKNTTPSPDSQTSSPKTSPGANTTLDKWSPISITSTPNNDALPAYTEEIPDIAVQNQNLEETEECDYYRPQNSTEFNDAPNMGNTIWLDAAAKPDEICSEDVEEYCRLNSAGHEQNWLNMARFDPNWADEMTKSCQKWTEAMAKHDVNWPANSKFDQDWSRNEVTEFKRNRQCPINIRQYPEPQDITKQNWPQIALTQDDIEVLQTWAEIAQNTQNINDKYENDNTHTIGVESVKPPGLIFENWTEQPQRWEEPNNNWLQIGQTSYNVPQVPQNSPQTPPNLLQPPPNLPQTPPKLPQTPPNLLQPPPNLLQPPPNLPQTPPKLPQTPPNLLQPPPNLLQPPPNLLQPPPNLQQTPPNLQQTPPNLLQTPPFPQTPPNLPQIPQTVPQTPYPWKHRWPKTDEDQMQCLDVCQFNNLSEVNKNGHEGIEAGWATETSLWINGKVSGIWSEDVLRELELLVAKDLEPGTPVEKWVPQDQLLKWLLTKESTEAADAPEADLSCDSVLDFMRGAHCAPHSSEIDLDLTDAEEVPVSGSSLAALSGRALSLAGQRHARALRTVAAEIQHRDRIQETIQQKNRPTNYPALPGVKHDSSCEEYPTRDIGLHGPSTNDPFITGSHRNNPNDKALDGNQEGANFYGINGEEGKGKEPKEEKRQILKLEMLKYYNEVPIKHNKDGVVKYDKIRDYRSEFNDKFKCQKMDPADKNPPFAPKEINNNDNGFKINRSWELECEVGRGRGRLHAKENSVGPGRGRGLFLKHPPK